MNQRLLPRLRKRLSITLADARAFTADVSAGGFAVELMRTLQPGSTVHGTVSVGERLLGFTGLVSWTKQAEPRLQVRGKSGIRLTGIDPAFYEWLLTA